MGVNLWRRVSGMTRLSERSRTVVYTVGTDSPERRWSGPMPLIALTIGLVLAGIFVVVHRQAKLRDIDAYARGYEAGLTDGMKVITTVPADPDVGRSERILRLEDELQSCALYVGQAEDRLKTVPAQLANARAFGWEAGYATAREDWKALPYDCRSLR